MIEIIIKSAGAAITVSAIALIIKKYNPELAMLLALAGMICLTAVAVSFAAELKDMADLIKKSAGISEKYVSPVIKCVGISIAVKLTADICRDSAQSGIASAFEFCGAVCATVVIMPLLTEMINTICKLV